MRGAQIKTEGVEYSYGLLLFFFMRGIRRHWCPHFQHMRWGNRLATNRLVTVALHEKCMASINSLQKAIQFLPIETTDYIMNITKIPVVSTEHRPNPAGALHSHLTLLPLH